MIDLYELAGADPEHRFSPYCWRIRMALAHKGLNARTIAWRFTEKTALPGSPPSKRVPVIVDRGEAVCDSTDIAYHLENAYPNSPSLFGGPGGEAQVHHCLVRLGACPRDLSPHSGGHNRPSGAEGPSLLPPEQGEAAGMQP
jgi:glutathione S-transferase